MHVCVLNANIGGCFCPSFSDSEYIVSTHLTAK